MSHKNPKWLLLPERNANNACIIHDRSGNLIASCKEKDAPLIRTAPELLEYSEALVAACEDYFLSGREDFVREAVMWMKREIKKAKGEKHV